MQVVVPGYYGESETGVTLPALRRGRIVRTPQDSSGAWRHGALPALLLAALVLAGHGVALWGGFVWDDRPLIVENTRIHNPDEFDKLLTSSFWETTDRHDRFRLFYRPLVSLSFAIDYALWGLRPLGFHLTNLLLHLTCCMLVYVLARAENMGRWAATAGAALFAVHPVHVESVAWISGRTDLICAALVFGSFLAYRRALGPTGSSASWIAALVLFAGALLAKEMAATLPLLVALDRWWQSPGSTNSRWRDAWSVALPFLGVLAAYLLFRFLLIGPSAEPLFVLDVVAWVATAAFALARYLTLLLVPVALDAHYPYQALHSLFDMRVVLSGAILAVLFVVAYRLRRRSPRITFWLTWTLVSLTPVLAFGRFGDVILADRFLYLPSLGPSILFAAAVGWFLEQRWVAARAVVATCVVGAVSLGLAAVSHHRTHIWRDDYALFSDMARTSPASALVRYNLGLAQYHRGEFDSAISEFQAAIELAPDYSMAHNNMAAALERQGLLYEALSHYRAALKIDPGQPETASNAGHLLTRLGQTDAGLRLLRDVVRENPEHAKPLYALGEALERIGQLRAASVYLEAARQADPDYASPYYLLGKIRSAEGRSEEAVEAMRTFLRLWPEDDRFARQAREVIERNGEPGA